MALRRSSAAATVATLLLSSMTAVAALSTAGPAFRPSAISAVARRSVLPLTDPSFGASEGRLTAAATATAATRPPWRACSLPSWRSSPSHFRAVPSDEDESPVDIYDKPDEFDHRTAVALVGGQALLVVAAVIASLWLSTPNYGLGDEFAITPDAVRLGALATAPLFILAVVLDYVEKSVPALKDVTMATQRSVLALLGGTFRPTAALGTAVALGAAAGLGEEMLFRGVLQSELSSWFGDTVGLAATSLVFGALHSVTPLYALLASVASVFFGYLYIASDNLAVPVVCHGLYDVGALLWAHWTVAAMTDEERMEIREWVSPVEKSAER